MTRSPRPPVERGLARVLRALALALALGAVPAHAAAQKTMPKVIRPMTLDDALTELDDAGIPTSQVRLFVNNPFIEIQLSSIPVAKRSEYEVMFTIPEPYQVMADNAVVGVIVVPPDGGGAGGVDGVDEDEPTQSEVLALIVVIVLQILVVILLVVWHRPSSGSSSS